MERWCDIGISASCLPDVWLLPYRDFGILPSRCVAPALSGFRHPASTWDGEEYSARNAVLFSLRALRRGTYLLVKDLGIIRVQAGCGGHAC